MVSEIYFEGKLDLDPCPGRDHGAEALAGLVPTDEALHLGRLAFLAPHELLRLLRGPDELLAEDRRRTLPSQPKSKGSVDERSN